MNINIQSSLSNVKSPLGTNYDIIFREENLKSLGRYFKQNILAEILPAERVSFCMRSVVPGRSTVKVFHNKEFKSAHYGNLMVCGSVWLCPVCASKISERRKVELIKGFENWHKGILMVTLTFSHKKYEKLGSLLEKLDNSYHILTNGRKWQDIKKRYKIRGSVSNLEITFGVNGWHPHKHIVFLVDNEFVYKDMDKELNGYWLECLKKSGASGLKGIAIKVNPVSDQKAKIAEYIAEHDKRPEKVWSIETELTKSYVKNSQNIWSILDNFILGGEYKDLLLIREYAGAIKGKKSVVFSKGLRKLLKIDDKSDLEVAKEKKENSELIYTLSRQIWDVVKKSKNRGQLLKVASMGDPREIEKFITIILLDSDKSHLGLDSINSNMVYR